MTLLKFASDLTEFLARSEQILTVSLEHVSSFRLADACQFLERLRARGLP
jgi:hypothetical protein